MTGTANSGGSGYSTAPTPVFTAGSGTGAAGTSTLSASRSATVVSVTVTNAGSGYTSAPTVTFSGSTATRAVGTATLNGPLQTFAGRNSIDTVTVTIGGKAPTHVAPTHSIQAAIDAARPGDMLMIDPLTQATATTAAVPAIHQELLLMWKPVRLQGVGAASSVLDGNTHPAGKLDPWRRQVNCLFGLALNGQPISAGNEYDPSGTYSCPTRMQQRVDRIPFEIILGWDVTANGNLAQMLQEPTLMGAYEGAGITVLGRGFRIPGTSTDFFGRDVEGGLPVGSAYLTNGPADCTIPTNTATPRDYGTSNFLCNPSRIDGITVTNSSQGGGAIFLHGWNHSMHIAN